MNEDEKKDIQMSLLKQLISERDYELFSLKLFIIQNGLIGELAKHNQEMEKNAGLLNNSQDS